MNFLTNNEMVDEMNTLNISGNVTPTVWFKTLVKDSGKPYLLAIVILADIVYWYRPTEVRDELTGQLVGYKKKFKSDLLQRSYDDISNLFGCSKKDAQRAVAYLEQKGIIERVFRTLTINGIKLSNVLFLKLIPTQLKKITFPSMNEGIESESFSNSDQPYGQNCPYPPTQNVQTNTKNTTEIINNISKKEAEERKLKNFENEKNNTSNITDNITVTNLPNNGIDSMDIPCPNHISNSTHSHSYKSKSNKSNKVKNKNAVQSFNQIIEDYTDNENLRIELKEYLKLRYLKKAPLTNRTLKFILNKLNFLSRNSDEDKTLIVRQALEKGTLTFSELYYKNRNYYGQYVYQNFGNHYYNNYTNNYNYGTSYNTTYNRKPSYDIESHERYCQDLLMGGNWLK